LHCYDLRGSDYDPGRPATIEPQVTVNHAGTVITAEPVDFKEKDYRRLRGGLNFLGHCTNLTEFLADQSLEQQKTGHIEQDTSGSGGI
jgi:hypothetical protein